MKVGTVTGPVWATKKCPALTGQILLSVRSDGQEFIAADRVILAFGGAARMRQETVPVDAAIIAILDEMREGHVR